MPNYCENRMIITGSREDLASWNKEKVLLYDYVGSSRICINYPLQRAVPVVQNAIAFLNLIQDTFLKADFVMKRL